MRSRLPKVLHPVCGVPMVEWVIDAAREAGADASSASPAPATAWPRRSRPTSRSPSRTRARAPAPPSSPAARRSSRATAILSSPATSRSPAPSDRGPVGRHRARAGGRDAAHHRASSTRPSTAGSSATPTASVERIVETKSTEGVAPGGARHPRDQHRHLRLRRAASCWRRSTRSPSRTNGERYLTTSSRSCTSAGGKIAAHRTDDTLSAMGVNNARRPDGGHAPRAAADPARARRAGVTFAAPDATLIDAGVEIGADTTIAPASRIRGATTIGGGCRIGPQHHDHGRRSSATA